MQPVLNRSQARRALRLPQKKRLVVYTGNMQANKGMESILEVASRLPDVDFLLVGGMPEHIRRLQSLSERLGAANVAFVGHQPVGRVPCYLYAADVLIVPPTRKPLAKYGRTVLPMKLFSYLAAGRPILAPALPDSGELLDHDQNACLVTPDDPDGTARALRELLADSKRRRSLSAGAARTADQLTWDARARKIKSWLLQRLAGKGGG
jgi:starch synthase